MPCHSIQKEEELWHLALSKHEYGNYLRRGEEMGHTTLFGRRFQVSALPTGAWTVANLDGGLFIIDLGLCHGSEPSTAIIARVSWLCLVSVRISTPQGSRTSLLAGSELASWDGPLELVMSSEGYDDRCRCQGTLSRARSTLGYRCSQMVRNADGRPVNCPQRRRVCLGMVIPDKSPQMFRCRLAHESLPRSMTPFHGKLKSCKLWLGTTGVRCVRMEIGIPRERAHLTNRIVCAQNSVHVGSSDAIPAHNLVPWNSLYNGMLVLPRKGSDVLQRQVDVHHGPVSANAI